MLRANVPLWFYWGLPPALFQPLDVEALYFAPRSHSQSRAPVLPTMASTASQSVGHSTSFVHMSPDQRNVERFLIRQKLRRNMILKKENSFQRQLQECLEKTTAKRSCPGKKGPLVFLWEETKDDVWTRTYITRGQVGDFWGTYNNSQQIYNSIDNCWDICCDFDKGTAGQMYEYDSYDYDYEIYPAKESLRSPSGQASDYLPMVVDPTPHSVPTAPQISMVVDRPHTDPTTTQVASDCPPPAQCLGVLGVLQTGMPPLGSAATALSVSDFP
jgi:hypothetical protein